LKPETTGLIPPGGYSANRRYSKKALMWLLHMERTDGCIMQHARKIQRDMNIISGLRYVPNFTRRMSKETDKDGS